MILPSIASNRVESPPENLSQIDARLAMHLLRKSNQTMKLLRQAREKRDQQQGVDRSAPCRFNPPPKQDEL